MKRVVPLILSMLLVFGLAACGGSKTPVSSGDPSSAVGTPGETEKPSESAKPSESEKPSEPEKPAEPKILRLVQPSAASSCHPAVSTQSAESSIYIYIHARLYRAQPQDGKVVILPDLADGEPVDVNGDGLTWNIKINPNAKWDNGDAINADTFLYSWKMTLDPKLVYANASRVASNAVKIVNAMEYYTQGSTGVAVAWEDVGFKKVDDSTIQIQLASKANAMMIKQHFSASSTVPVYQPLFEKCLSADGTSCSYGTSIDTVACSGPFKLTNWVIGSVREYEKNENYVHADKIKLDGIIQQVVPDSSTQQLMFESGELDYITLSTDAQKQYGDDPRVVKIPSRYTRHFEFCTTNTENPIVNNVNFRLALYYATDRAAIAKISGDEPGAGLVHVPATTDGTTFRQLAQQAGYMPANDGYDPEKALAYFEKALQETGQSSVEVSVVYNSGTSDLCYIAEFVQESWANIFGKERFKLVLNGLPSAQAKTTIGGWKTNPSSYELALTAWSVALGDYDPLRALYVYTSEHSNRNAPYGSDAYLEGLYAEGCTDENRLNPEKRTEQALKMEQYILETALVVPVLYDNSAGIMSNRVILAVENYDLDLGWGWMYADLAQ